jgi:6-phosphogluconate dehydrogenase
LREAGDAALGLIGLGVMGRNLALNLSDKGVAVAGWDADAAARAAFAAGPAAADLPDLLRRLRRPRALLLMVPAGKPVDEVIEALLPQLAPGDLVADGGNSHHRDTARRATAMAGRGVAWLGLGISGGEAGARHGPAIMAGGEKAAYDRLAPMLEAIGARAGGWPCVAWLGPGGAGHFVKMVHNGIEYAVMQLLAEAAYLLRHLDGLGPEAAAECFAEWNRGPLESYLVGITAEVLAATDAETGRPLVDMIRDRAGEKGTGRWAAVAALELGVAAPSLVEAVTARAMTALPRGRDVSPPPPLPGLADDLPPALLAAIICCYAQGFALLEAAGHEHGWALPLGRIAGLWQGGCIIRAALLSDFETALGRASEPLIDDPALAPAVMGGLAAWRRLLAAAIGAGLPVPVLAASLAWHDAQRRPRLWADVIQAQRDRFGRHGFERVDRPGLHHHDWGEP